MKAGNRTGAAAAVGEEEDYFCLFFASDLTHSERSVTELSLCSAQHSSEQISSEWEEKRAEQSRGDEFRCDAIREQDLVDCNSQSLSLRAERSGGGRVRTRLWPRCSASMCLCLCSRFRVLRAEVRSIRCTALCGTRRRADDMTGHKSQSHSHSHSHRRSSVSILLSAVVLRRAFARARRRRLLLLYCTELYSALLLCA